MSRIFDSLNFASLNPIRKPDNGHIQHPLSYEWTFWQHNRISSGSGSASASANASVSASVSVSASSKPNDEENASDNENDVLVSSKPNPTTLNPNKLRDVQYLEDTTLLKFPKIYDNSGAETTDINTVEQFWNSYINLKSVVDTPAETEYFFFKKGIKPLWEDEHNKKGGKWSLSFPANNSNSVVQKKFLALLWELLLFKLISGKFIEDNVKLPLNEDFLDNKQFKELEGKVEMSNKELNKLVMEDIAGIVISIRSKKIIVSIWNTHLGYENYCDSKNVQLKLNDYSNFYNKLNERSKQIFEEAGMTSFQFRKLIFDSVTNTMNEAIGLISSNLEDLQLGKDFRNEYRHKHFKYSLHFEPLIANAENGSGLAKKHNAKIAKSKKLVKEGGQTKKSEATEKMNSLGKLRKKIEFNEEGLMVEELNVVSTFTPKQKPTWSRRRRNVLKEDEVEVDE